MEQIDPHSNRHRKMELTRFLKIKKYNEHVKIDKSIRDGMGAHDNL
jgi:hypothetical protein